MAHVFISYSKKNKTYAQELKVQLLNLGFDVWIDEVIEPGDGWFRSIRQAIKDCAAFVLIMTPESENSHWVNLELLHALEYHKPIFPLLRAGGSNPLDSDVWAQIANVQFTDVRDGSMPADRFYERLIKRGVPRQLRGQDITPPSVEAPSVGEGLRPSPTNPPDKTPVPEPAPPAPTPPPASSISPRPEGEGQGVRAQAPLALPDVSAILPPPFEWCWIPAGKVTLEAGGYVPKGGQTFDVPAFAIAKYPVTNAQFRKFEAAEGYKQLRWWPEESWHVRTREKWLLPRFSNDKKWNGDDYPVVGVSWYEAMAFCQWLTESVGAHGRAPLPITLPTEQQWQRAAQGDDGRVYPWGNEVDANRCNVVESGIGRTTPVTQYPTGASPYGVLDMAGNMWEWCLTEYMSGVTDTNRSYSNMRVLRGGSWHNIQNFARATYRIRLSLGSRDYDVGFRVVCCPPSA